MWAAEQWIQGLGPDTFKRYPTWKELTAPLYRTENGIANRSWGFRKELPPVHLPAPADPQNGAAYLPFESNGQPSLPSARQGCPLTPGGSGRTACSGHKMQPACRQQ